MHARSIISVGGLLSMHKAKSSISSTGKGGERGLRVRKREKGWREETNMQAKYTPIPAIAGYSTISTLTQVKAEGSAQVISAT